MNIVNQEFNDRKQKEVIVSDLTYVRVGSDWNYVCVIVDLFNREVIDYSAGSRKTAQLVKEAFATIKGSLSNVQYFHSDRGAHYRWPQWIELMNEFSLTRSMSKKGCSPDNSACEGFFGTIKEEMFNNRDWRGWSLEDFINYLHTYLEWFSSKRIKLSLNGMSPIEYRHSLGL